MFFKKKEEKSFIDRVASVSNLGEYMIFTSAMHALLEKQANRILQSASQHLSQNEPLSAYVYLGDERRVVFKNIATKKTVRYDLSSECEYKNYRYIEYIEKDIILDIQSELLSYPPVQD